MNSHIVHSITCYTGNVHGTHTVVGPVFPNLFLQKSYTECFCLNVFVFMMKLVAFLVCVCVGKVSAVFQTEDYTLLTQPVAMQFTS